MEWGAVGGPAAREAALWVQLQREFRNRNLLPVQAIRRLDALDFPWEPQVAPPPALPLSCLVHQLKAAYASSATGKAAHTDATCA